MDVVGLNVLLGADFSSAEEAMTRFYASVQSLAKNVQSVFSNMGGTASSVANMFKPISDGAQNASKIAINESKARQQADNEETQSALNASKIRIQAIREEVAAQRAATAAKRAEKDLYSQFVADQNAVVREYYNAATALHLYGQESGFTAEKIAEMAEKARLGQEQLKSIEAGAGRFQRNVGNYSGATAYLQQSIAQLSGEIPNFFQSMRIGFMSIGNNIQPISMAIKGLRAENAQLLAQGKQTVPVLSTVIKSFLGWQTVLLVGVGLISAYGGKMVELISDLSSGATATDKLAKAQKESGDKLLSTDQITKDYVQTLKSIDQARTNAIEKGAGEIAQIRQLTSAMTNTNVEIGVRKNAYDKLIALYPQLNKYATEEEALTGGLAKTINMDLIPALLKRAAVEGIQGAIAATYKAQADAMINQVVITNKVVDAQKDVADATKKLHDTHILQNGGLMKVAGAWIDVYKAQQKVNKTSEANLTNSAALVDTQKKLPELAKLLATATEDLSNSFLGGIAPATALEDKLKSLNAVLTTQTEGTESYKKTYTEIQNVSKQLEKYKDSHINAKVHVDALTKSQNNLNAEFAQTERKLSAGVIDAYQAMKENIATVTQHLDKLFKNGGTQAAIQQDIELLRQMNYQLASMAKIDLNSAKGNLFGGNAEKELHSYMEYIQKIKDSAAGLYNQLGIQDPKDAIKRRQLSTDLEDKGIDSGRFIDPKKSTKEQVKDLTKGGKELNREFNHTYSILNRVVGGPLDSFTDAIFNGENAMEALGNSIKDIVKNLAEAVIKAGIFSAIMSAINPTGFAAGGGFGGILGKLLPFATGGVVTGPTPALIGEAGPEAVIPLNKLGSIMGSRDVNVNVRGDIRGRAIKLANDRESAFKTR